MAERAPQAVQCQSVHRERSCTRGGRERRLKSNARPKKSAGEVPKGERKLLALPGYPPQSQGLRDRRRRLHSDLATKTCNIHNRAHSVSQSEGTLRWANLKIPLAARLTHARERTRNRSRCPDLPRQTSPHPCQVQIQGVHLLHNTRDDLPVLLVPRNPDRRLGFRDNRLLQVQRPVSRETLILQASPMLLSAGKHCPLIGKDLRLTGYGS